LSPWAHDAIDNVAVPLIAGVDYLLNGIDTTEDFWARGLVIHDDGQGTIHTVVTPEPATLILLGLGGLALLKRKR
jgi:hypothetical protein